jgi:hypothetical protein
MRTAVLATMLAAAAAVALAQTPPPVAPLLDPGAVPGMPPDTRLPGPDPRQCGPSKYAALCAEGRWTHFSRIALDVSAPQFTAQYRLEQAANGELHVTYREKLGATSRGGEIVLFGIEGFAYRSKDTFPDPGSIIDYSVSSPIIMAQLATLLLDLGALVSPAEITQPRAIGAENATQYIRTAAPRLAALYGPPWSVTGSVRPAGPQEVAFSLRLRYRPVDARGAVATGKTETVTLEGKASFTARRPTLPDTLDLAGWKVMKGETPMPAARTLAEARSSAGG